MRAPQRTEIRERATIDAVEVAAYKIPTDSPESDGTLEWDSTTIVVVHVRAGGETGLGYTYGHHAIATLIADKVASVVTGYDAMDIPAAWHAMWAATRNIGRPGIVSMAMAAVDNALWDLKARLLGLPLVRLLGRAQSGVTIYGSGGFTSYDTSQLTRQLGGWADQGFTKVKMKVGRDPGADIDRVRHARAAIGPTVELFVDGNGAYSRKEAIAFANAFAHEGVTWFEEPVSSDDLDGLRLVRDNAPPPMDVAAGEYGWQVFYFRRMLAAEAVDVLQVDVTRCGGITGFLRAAALADAFSIPLSGHCAPALHLHVGAALAKFRHIEYFHDHVRIENMLFDGTVQPDHGRLYPNLDRPGHGLRLKAADAARFAV